MRYFWLAGGLIVAGCSSESAENKADQAAAAENYVPPSVTSRLDYGGMIERRFRRLDRNQDDRIARDELPRVDSRAITSLDSNGDGLVSQDEFSIGQLARFDANDLNKDGSVTSVERKEYRARP